MLRLTMKKKGWGIMRKTKLKKGIAYLLSAALSLSMVCGIKSNVTAAEASSVVTTTEIASSEAVRPVTTTVSNEEGNVEFKITRDKAAYKLGEEITLTIRATNVSNKAIEIGNFVGNMKEQGCLKSYLTDESGKRLFEGLYMKDGKMVERIGQGSFSGELNAREAIEGQQVIRTTPLEGKEAGTYYIEIGFERDYYKYSFFDDRIYYVKIPVIIEGNMENPVSYDAVTFEDYGVTETITDPEGAITFEVTRDKEGYRFGEEILLAIKATNVSTQAVQIKAPSTTLGEAGCLEAKLFNSTDAELFGSGFMTKEDDYYISIGVMNDLMYYGEVKPGETIEGWLYIVTQYNENQLEQNCSLVISMECTVDEEEKLYSISIPIHMLEGSDPLATEIPCTEIPESSYSPEEATTMPPIFICTTCPPEMCDGTLPPLTDCVLPKPEESQLPEDSETTGEAVVPEESDNPEADDAVTQDAVKLYTLGDINEDGKVTLEDASEILKYALKIKIPQSVVIRFIADADGDGQIVLNDAAKILKVALKIEDKIIKPYNEMIQDGNSGDEAIKSDDNKNESTSSGDSENESTSSGDRENEVNTDVDSDNKSIWKEIPVPEDVIYSITCGMGKFDLEEIKKEADYVFRGTVVDRKQYEVSWYDEKGEQWGPFTKSVIEVKVNEEYYGTSPVSGDTIKIYYSLPIEADLDGNFKIQDDAEYVFVTKALDEEFVAMKQQTAPDDKYEQEKHADVYIGDTCYDVMSVEDGNVIFYKNYFADYETILSKILPKEQLQTNRMTSEYILKLHFAALGLEDFEEAISLIFQ